MRSADPLSKSPDSSSRLPYSPAHLYNRAGIFYFRLVLTENLRQRLGRVEIRLSLRTAYRRKALDLSRRLYAYFFEVAGNMPLITYKELRRRLNIYLQKQLEDDHNNIFARPSIADYPVLAEDHPEYTLADILRRHAEVAQKAANNPEYLNSLAHVFHDELIRCGILQPGEVSSKYRLELAKAYLQSQVTYYKLLEKRSQGDYLSEEPIVSADFGEPPKTSAVKEEFEKLIREEELKISEKNTVQANAGGLTEVSGSVNQPHTKPSMLYSEAIKEEFEKLIREEELMISGKNTVQANAGGLTEVSGAVDKPPTKPSMLYSEAIQVFIKNKVDETRWKPHMLAEHQGQLKTFLDIMGDMELGRINREIMRKYREILSKLPPNYSRAVAYKGKTIPEILALAPKRVISPVRVNILIQAVSSLMDWFVAEEIISSNPAKKLQKKDARQAIELRLPFEKRDLEKIFSHPKFALGEFKLADYFWVPLIALFSGMRLEEICQLHCADIREVNGIWVMDINNSGKDEDGFEKTLKNINARRLVPIHKTLIDLGFLRYHKRITESNNIRVFPNLNKSESVGKYGKQAGKQFNDLVKTVLNSPGYIAEKKSFHSLRHNFADFYKQRGLQTDVFRQLYGHEIPELAARQYSAKFPPEKLYEVVSALDYEIDISSLLKESKYVK